MAKSQPVLHSFVGGEWSPTLHGRSDLPQYLSACGRLENWLVLPQGGVDHRRGFRYVGSTKFPGSHARLVPFRFSATDSYMLEMGVQYLRFYRHGQLLTGAPERVVNGRFDTSIGGWSNLSTGSGTLGWHHSSPTSGTLFLQTRSTTGVAHTEQAVPVTAGQLHRLQVRLPRISDNRFAIRSSSSYSLFIRVGTTSGGEQLVAFKSHDHGSAPEFTFTPPGSTIFIGFAIFTLDTLGFLDDVSVKQTTSGIYEVATPFVEGDLPRVRTAQSADVMWFTHTSHDTRTLSRLGEADFSFAISRTDGPYQPKNLVATRTLTPSVSAVGATGTLSASGHLPFVALHVGSVWQLQHGSNPPGAVEITSFTSSSQVGILVLRALAATTATPDWAIGEWSAIRGDPTSVTFSPDNRQVFAGSVAKPQTVWLSATDDYGTFAGGTVEDSSLAFTFVSGEINGIQWVMPFGRGVLVGTVGREHWLKPPDNGPLTPTSFDQREVSAYGSDAVAPVKAGAAVLFVELGGRRIREALYQDALDGIDPEDLTLFADHLTEPRIVELVYQGRPVGRLWAITSEGALLACTYLRAQKVLAWARQPVAGDGRVESIAVIPTQAGTSDELWGIVRRDSATATSRSVERLDCTAPRYTDSHVVYTGAPTQTVTGLGHLDGRTVSIIGDGVIYPSKVVTGGTVTLEGAMASDVEVGLYQPAVLETLPVESGNPAGSAADLTKRFSKLWVRLVRTVGLSVNGKALPFRTAAMPMGAAVTPFTGIKRTPEIGWDREGVITIEQPQPLPATVLAVGGTLDIGGAS